MLWSTQTLSGLGSGMTGYALVLWLYLRSASGHAFIKAGRWRDEPGYGQYLRGTCDFGRKRTCYVSPRTEKPNQSDLPYTVYFHECGEFYAGIWENTAYLVYWRCFGLAVHTAYECQYGCGISKYHTG